MTSFSYMQNHANLPRQSVICMENGRKWLLAYKIASMAKRSMLDYIIYIQHAHGCLFIKKGLLLPKLSHVALWFPFILSTNDFSMITITSGNIIADISRRE